MCWWLRLLVGRGRIKESLWSTKFFNPLFLYSSEKPEWRSTLIWGCDYLIYLIWRKSLQVCSGTCSGQNGNQLGMAMEAEAQTSIRLTQSKSFILLLVTWVRSPSSRLLADLVKPYISYNTSLGQCCEMISICCMKVSVLCWGAFLSHWGVFFLIPYHSKGEEVTGPRSRGRHHPFFIFF